MSDYSTGLTASYAKKNLAYTDIEDVRWWYIVDNFQEDDPEYGHKEGVCINAIADGKVRSVEVTISFENLVDMVRTVLRENGGGSLTLSED